MANEATNNTGYGYVEQGGSVAAQVFAVSNGLACRVAFVQPDGFAGVFTDLGDAEFEWEGRILPTVADCEAELMGNVAVSAA
ncbi:MAG TPA: hypothetical protein VKP88_02675 [Candidatus Paceibacterota bacterium]|nr:hypothetical protein [Candidatus Paceibacterota bacterium]